MLAERVKEWTKEWKEEGLQQGMQQGTAQVILHQLKEKFGRLSPELESKVERAENKQLFEWSKRILTANTLGDVFGN